jgi:hypothetical protein
MDHGIDIAPFICLVAGLILTLFLIGLVDALRVLTNRITRLVRAKAVLLEAEAASRSIEIN